MYKTAIYEYLQAIRIDFFLLYTFPRKLYTYKITQYVNTVNPTQRFSILLN